MSYSVSTYGSHSALQIMRGAKDEGLKAILICPQSRYRLYNRFKLADKIVLVKNANGLLEEVVQEYLLDEGAIFVPHGTIISDTDLEKFVENFKVPVFGNRHLLIWESDRYLKERLMREAGIYVPKCYQSPDEVDGPVIVKLHGAKGGAGYFLASGRDDLLKKLTLLDPDLRKELFIQEYVIGVTIYPHFFYSPLNDELELLGIDRRYETNVDAIGRLPAKQQLDLDIKPTYHVVGNLPLVLRESMLESLFDIAERFVKACKKLVQPGVIGPFCLEACCRSPDEIIVFEFSGRIVAGTNIFVPNSPYAYFIYGEGMYMGRRIAREIKLAYETSNVDKVTT